MIRCPDSFRPLAAAAVFGIVIAASAHADDHRSMPMQALPEYQRECASCHTAYPPGMLPAQSWQRVMRGLDSHYGTDASLDATTLQQIDTWLQAHAGTHKRVAEAPPQDRITRSAWFERKHREIQPEVWRLASVRSAANCGACHVAAGRGRFDEDDLRIPAGLGAHQRRAWND